MGTISKKLKREKPSKGNSEDECQSDEDLHTAVSGEYDDSLFEYGDDAYDDNEDQDQEEEEEDEDVEDEGFDVENDEENNDYDEQHAQRKDGEPEELEKEYMDLQNMEQNLVQNLKRHKDEDLLKGKTMKNQKALWDKIWSVESYCRGLSQNQIGPQEPSQSSFCEFDGVCVAYVDLIESSKRTIDSKR